MQISSTIETGVTQRPSAAQNFLDLDFAICVNIFHNNQSDKFILAIVIVDGDEHEGPYYIRDFFSQEPEFGVASSNYSLSDLLSKSTTPESTV